ncbi:hypothetical protein K505DRAFT_323585 [Melanomma pulvis-pyrius CBS 109.77]|uniref:Uncharacterized protein n=1 Tax=Melanomma pulvis-pyrius CBS 109.77 TaxID=1314802 RepID=A0A6A6XIP0_9PLEO|nr:hypothetical protein K505DRAFT_323585 [Melanomma pulvis-pyrius CBS 109.77]
MASEEKVESAAMQHSIINSTFPVHLPEDLALHLPETKFQEFVEMLLDDDDGFDFIEGDATATADGTVNSSNLKRRATSEAESTRAQKSTFMEGLRKHEAHSRTKEELAAENKTVTENADVTNISAKNPLVDLFYDLSANVAGDKLEGLLDNAWDEDALMALKIIFNARSIHLGKGDRMVAYQAFGWLAEKHPLTLLTNLKWLVRPVIQKKVLAPEGKANIKSEQDGDFDMVNAESKDTPTDETEKTHHVRFGVSHGYWKDILNLLVFAANDELKLRGDHKSLLNQHPDTTAEGMRKREWDPVKAKDLRKAKTAKQHERVLQKLKEPFYRRLHLTVARLFATQLKEDAALLKSGKKSDLNELSLAAKWAPTFAGMHDSHTFVLSSIAEFLFPTPEEVCPMEGNRELYLKSAREAYRRTIGSPLRKALSVVERDITAASPVPNRFARDINYERIPSLAMDRYTSLFIKKDFEKFAEYTKKVAEGSAKMSGATLLPSTLIQKALRVGSVSMDITQQKTFAAVKASAEAKVTRQVIDGQWNALVQRIRDSGTIESSISVCDVSGSMSSPQFADGTTPMDSAIGLSLLLAEVTAPPFGGSFITFSDMPTVISVGGEQDTRGLVEKAARIQQSPWGFNTDFVAVFEDLILPMAIKNNLKQEDMVKQIFVFSDMQFDAAGGTERWTSSFKRIKGKYAASGFEMPKLIFWNLAGGNTEKPTTMDDVNTALVSGYSQGMLKVFLDGGGFEDTEEEEVEVVENDDGVAELVVKKKMDPLTIVNKAVSHDAYGMLKIVD